MRGTGEIGRQQTGECRLLPLALVLRRIHVVDLPARRRFRFAARAHRDTRLGSAADAVGIRHDEPALVLGGGLQIEDASRKSVGRHVVQRVLVEPLVPDAQEGRSSFPGLLALPAVEHRDGGVAVVIAIDLPLESERDERRRFSDEFPGGRLVRGSERRGPEEREDDYRESASYGTHEAHPLRTKTLPRRTRTRTERSSSHASVVLF